jgi:phage terminase large subunit-like protein
MNMAWDLYKYAKQVASGEEKDEGFLPILFESPPDVDWKDENAWRAVNPGLKHGFPDMDGLRQLAREAQNRPGEREAFMQYHLNCWLDGAAAPWLDMSIYDSSAGEPVSLDDLTGQPCVVGVDLGATDDLSSVVAVFPRDDGTVIVKPFFFVPEESLRRRQERDSVPYLTWRDEGFLTATSGNVADHDAIESFIRELAERFAVGEVVIDAWAALGIINHLVADGIPVTKFRQGFASMSPAVMETERTILSGNLRHGGHPVLRWNFQNCTIDRDPAGNQKFNKARSAEKIDGAVACAMALCRARAGDNGPSVYDTDAGAGGLLVLG